MKTIKVERYEEITVILEQGIDYERRDLTPDWTANNKLYHVNLNKLNKIAKENGYDRWYWVGHADSDLPGTNKVTFRKTLD